MPQLDEVNFWQPSGQNNFRALNPGELFLFKLHAPNDFIVGGGVFAKSSIVPISVAWEAFGIKNGAQTYEEFRAAVIGNRHGIDSREDFNIGCRILTQPFFWPREQWLDLRGKWQRLSGPGRVLSLESGLGAELWRAVQERFRSSSFSFREEEPERYGEPMLIKPRLGQGAFRIAVTDAYERRCAVTGERTLPVLDAAHIRPYGRGGEHELSNGILLRKDIHALFDRGYVTISPGNKFVVSSRIREKFANGRHYYEMHGQPIRQPSDISLQPSSELLEWHRSEIFLKCDAG
jgi:putative restriction endonuclease